jgi:hypothetical protein
VRTVRQDIADEPGPFSTEATAGPADRHTLLNLLRDLSARLDATDRGNGIPASNDAYRGDSIASAEPLSATKLRTGEIPGRCHLHDVKQSAALDRAAALPVVTTSRHACFLCLNSLANWDGVLRAVFTRRRS